MTIVTYTLMILAGAGMVFAHYKHKKSAGKKRKVLWARPLAGFCGTLALCLALWNLIATMWLPTRDRSEAVRWEQVQCAYLGQFLGAHNTGRKVLIVHDPIDDYSQKRVQAMIASLMEGFGGRLEVVAMDSPPVPEIPVDETAMDDTALVEPFCAKNFDAMIARHPDCNLVVSLIGLPMDYQSMTFWKMPDKRRPRLAVLQGPVMELKKAIEAGFIDAAVTYKPDADFTPQPPPDNLDVAFNQRYLLAHSGNVAQIERRYKDFFVQ